MKLTSSAFEENGSIPAKYTCDGNRFLSPPLSIAGVPQGAASLVLIVDDPDAPKELVPSGAFTHWMLFNIPPDATEIPEGEQVGQAGANERGDAKYTGPCPPPEYEPSEHRYVFTLHALDAELDLPEGASRADLEHALTPHEIERTALVGRYARIG
jgi:Raf kinase inhibitor-like YbhB/YbcL family protein